MDGASFVCKKLGEMLMPIERGLTILRGFGTGRGPTLLLNSRLTPKVWEVDVGVCHAAVLLRDSPHFGLVSFHAPLQSDLQEEEVSCALDEVERWMTCWAVNPKQSNELWDGPSVQEHGKIAS